MGYVVTHKVYELPPVEKLRELLRYEPETGKLYWRDRGRDMRWNNRNAGKEAFTNNGNGYKRGSILGRMYQAHRIIWKMHYGTEPPDQIDHINRELADNRIANLRGATNVENARNRRLLARNTSGATGVATTPNGAWRAYIAHEAKQIHLGTYDTREEAVIARKAAEKLWEYLRDDA